MKCNCKVKSVLEGSEAAFIKYLFKLVNKKMPHMHFLGLLDASNTALASECPHMYSWGYEFYCANQDVIKKFQKSK